MIEKYYDNKEKIVIMEKDCDKKEKIKKITLHKQAEGSTLSSIVNEGIRALLNLFIYFFYKKISHAQKA